LYRIKWMKPPNQYSLIDLTVLTPSIFGRLDYPTANMT